MNPKELIYSQPRLAASLICRKQRPLYEQGAVVEGLTFCQTGTSPSVLLLYTIEFSNKPASCAVSAPGEFRNLNPLIKSQVLCL